MKLDCENCIYYEYDEEFESYVCEANIDEDELVRLMGDSSYQCPYFRVGNEYSIVRKQM